MSSSVLDGLRSSSKGKLSYKSQLDSVNYTERRKVLDELTSPTTISSEVIKILAHRSDHVSLNTPSHNRNTSPSSVGSMSTEAVGYDGLHTTSSTNRDHSLSLPHTPQYAPFSVYSNPAKSVRQSQLSSTRNKQLFPPQSHMYRLEGSNDEADYNQGYSPNISNVTESEPSVIDGIYKELDDCVESIEDRLMAEVVSNLEFRNELFAEKLERIRQESQDELQKQLRARKNQLFLKTEKKKAKAEQEKIEIRRIIEELEEQYKTQYETMEARLKSGEDQKKEILKRMDDRRKKALEKLIQQCYELIAETKRIPAEVVTLFRSCTYPQFLSQAISEGVNESILVISSVHSQLVKEVESGNPDPKNVAHLHAKLTETHHILSELKTAVDEADHQGKIEAKKLEDMKREEAKKLELEEKSKQTEEKKIKEENKVKKESKTATSSDDKSNGLRISKSMLDSYSFLHDKLSQTVKTCTGLTSTTDLALKKYRFDLQKAVTGTINSVSCNSGEGLIEKIVYLKRLLSGQSVQVGTKSVSIERHADAKLYCCNLLAAKIVKQGEDQVASNNLAAFPLAALAIGVWTDFEDVGTLMLAHFYATCPVLVPMYVSKTAAMSDGEFMKSQGYKVSDDGSVESQDLFLNRIRGTVRLYAAIIQTPQLPSSHPVSPHPHGLEYGWAWLARVLNMEPDPLVTAAALGDFLEIAGHSLMKKYTVQFKKILFVLWKEYIPKIESVTQPSDRGPLARLTLFLEDCIKAGQIPEPKGCLTEQFWRTRSLGIAIA